MLLKIIKQLKLIQKKVIKIIGKKYLKPIHIDVPGDPSSAAFATLTILKKFLNNYKKCWPKSY